MLAQAVQLPDLHQYRNPKLVQLLFIPGGQESFVVLRLGQEASAIFELVP